MNHQKTVIQMERIRTTSSCGGLGFKYSSYKLSKMASSKGGGKVCAIGTVSTSNCKKETTKNSVQQSRISF